MLFGLYRGFIQSVLSLGGSLLSIVGSFLLYPRLADVVASNTDITRMISTYTDSQSLLGDLDLSSQAVSGLAGDAITQVVQKANLSLSAPFCSTTCRRRYSAPWAIWPPTWATT